tara:strand:- start:1420 stop:1647 length:228 start_codon:yes stop_codon:yes gene_type:complete
MKIGDLVKSKTVTGRPRKAGLIVDLVEKKCWRTDEMGKRVNWNEIGPEPHAVVLIEGRKLTVPLTDLELIDISLT